MAPNDKNEILMAHMFLKVPPYMESQIERFSKVLTLSAQTPEFLMQQPVVSELVSKKTAGLPLTSPPNLQNQTLEMKSCSAGDWVVQSDQTESVPLKFSDALLKLLHQSSDTAILKNKTMSHVLQKDFVARKFESFAQQLERNLKEAFKKTALQNQTTLDLLASGPQPEGEEAVWDSRPDSPEAVHGKRATAPTMPTVTADKNPYMSNNMYKSAFESRTEESFQFPEQDYPGSRRKQGGRTNASEQPSYVSGPSRDAGQGSQDEDDSIVASNSRRPRPTPGHPLLSALEGNKFSSANLEEVFSLCNGAAKFFNKIKQDNLRFYGGERGEEGWPSGSFSEEPAYVAPAPARAPQFVEGKVYTPADLKTAPSMSAGLNFSTLVENKKINLRTVPEQRNPYSNLAQEFPYFQDEPAPRKPEKPRAPQGYKEYEVPREFYPQTVVKNYVNDEDFEDFQMESFHSESGRSAQATPFHPAFAQTPPPPRKDRVQTKRLMGPATLDPEDYGKGYHIQPNAPQYGAYPSQKQSSSKTFDTSNPYVNSHFEMNNLDYQNPATYHAQGFTGQDSFSGPIGSNVRSKNKPPSGPSVPARNQKPQKVYTKRA